MMDNKIIFGIIFMAILISSFILSWIMYSSKSIEPEPTELKSLKSLKSANLISAPKNISKPKIVIPKPPPNVYWSEFNEVLLDLEQENMLILHTISPIKTKSVIQQTAMNIKIVPQDINWSNVGKTLFELEQLRKDIIGLLQEKSVPISE